MWFHALVWGLFFLPSIFAHGPSYTFWESLAQQVCYLLYFGGAVYSNRFFLLPWLYRRGHRALYFILSFVLAVAYGLAKPPAWFDAMRAGYAASRDRLAGGLRDLGFRVLPAEATWFLNIDIAPLGETDDVAFCRRLVMDHGVAAIPVSAFYANGSVKTVVRFCFAKRDATLDAALERLAGVAKRAA